MFHLGSLRAYPPIDGDADIRGAKVYDKNNEKLGSIVDVVLDHESGDIRYAVVEAGGWLHTHEFLIPADDLELLSDDTDPKNDRFKVNVEKRLIERLPAFDASHLTESRWQNYERAYIDAWTEEPVLHREGESTHTITPTAEEMPIPPSSAGLGIHSEPLQPRGTLSSLNSSGASDVTLTPVTSTMDTRYGAASSGRPVGTHGLGNLREEVSPGATEGAKETKEQKLRRHLADEAENARTITGDAIYNSADIEGLRNEPFARESRPVPDAASPQQFGNAESSRGRRWTNFQNHLRANREAIAKCQSYPGQKKDVA